MRKTKEILRLALQEGLSHREIAASTGVGKTTIQEILARAKEKELKLEDIKVWREHEIVEKLFPREPSNTKIPVPEWPFIKQELLKKGVTLLLLWLDYPKFRSF